MGLNSALRVLVAGVSLGCTSDNVRNEGIGQASDPHGERARFMQRRADEYVGLVSHEERKNAGILVNWSAQKIMRQKVMSPEALRDLRAIRRQRRLRRKLMRRRRHRNCRKFKRRRVVRGKGIRQRKRMRTRGFRRGRTRWRRCSGRREERALPSEPPGDLERLIFSWYPYFPSDAASPEEPRDGVAKGSIPSTVPTCERPILRRQQRRRFGSCVDNAKVGACIPSRRPCQKYFGVGGDSECPPSVIPKDANTVWREVGPRRKLPKRRRERLSTKATLHSFEPSDLPFPPGMCPRKGIAGLGFHDERQQPLYGKIWNWIGTQLGKAFSSNDSGDGPEYVFDSGESSAICETDDRCLQLVLEAVSGVLRREGRAHDLEADVSRWRVVELDSDGRVIGLKVLFRKEFLSVELEGSTILGLLQLRGLQSLRLWNARLKGLPEEIGQLQQLQTLDLSGNQLQGLPGEIGRLQHLQLLTLSSNQLQGLPREIGQLQHLHDLGLSNNRLQDLPGEIGRLQRLQKLGLNYNQLQGLPGEIGQLQQLKKLGLNYNQLQGLPGEIGQLQQLQHLYLSNNQLQCLPGEIGQLQQLRLLYICNNQLKGLPGEIGHLQQLRDLGLSNNRLKGLPGEIGRLVQLNRLHLSFNRLQGLPGEIGQLQQLHDLRLVNNQLQGLPEEVGQLQQLQHLDLSYNRLQGLPGEIGQLQQLQKLGVNANLLQGLPGEIGQLQQLQYLYLSKNLLQGLPGEIGRLQQLQKLGLNHNQLQGLPGEIGQLQQLEQLGISNNQLQGLPGEIGRLQQLRELKVSNNQLQGLPGEIGQLQRLRHLYVSNNQLQVLWDHARDTGTRDKGTQGQLPAGLAKLLAWLEGIPCLRLLPNEFVEPPEAVVATGMHAVKAYYTDLFAEGFTVKQREVKVVIVGMAGAGKTR